MYFNLIRLLMIAPYDIEQLSRDLTHQYDILKRKGQQKEEEDETKIKTMFSLYNMFDTLFGMFEDFEARLFHVGSLQMPTDFFFKRLDRYLNVHYPDLSHIENLFGARFDPEQKHVFVNYIMQRMFGFSIRIEKNVVWSYLI